MTDTTELQAENDKLRALCGKLSTLCEQSDDEYLEDAVRRVLAERNGLREVVRSFSRDSERAADHQAMTDTTELRRRLDLLETALERRETFGGPDVYLDSSVRRCARELIHFLRAEDAAREKRRNTPTPYEIATVRQRMADYADAFPLTTDQ